MKKITNKIIFMIITCASIISVASLTKTNAQEISRNELTQYTTNMESVDNATNIRTQSEEVTVVAKWDVSKNQDDSVIAVLTTDGTLTISGTGNMKNYYHDNEIPYYNDKESIKKVIIEEGVTSIGYMAFNSCSSLTSVEIPEGVTSIGYGAFDGCSSLTNIEIPEGVTSIGGCAFYFCSSLTSIEIPSSVTSIGDWAFNYCTSLTNIIVDNDNNAYCSENGVLFNKDKTQLIEYPEGKTDTEYIITEGVTSIENNAFYRCSSLTSIEIPSSVTSIGFYAFEACSSLTSIEIPSSVTSIGGWAFRNCSSLTSIEIPSSVTSIGDSAFSHCRDLTITTPCNSEYVINYANKNAISTKLIHNWGEWTIDKEATCEEAGEKSHHCTECGERTDITTIEALGHDWKEATYTWNEDKTECTAERICTRDASHKETETVKTTNSVTKEATCEEVGERTYTATFKNEAFAQQITTEEIKATGHKEGTAVEENRVEATCTQEGHYDEVIYCTVCNKEINRVQKTIKAKGHTYSTEWTIDKEATCEETGEKSHHCTECEERADITTIEALGHDYQIKSTAEAVCEKGGTIIYECTRCKATKQETIPATGHREEIDAAVEPTCTEKGKTEGKHCSVCGKVLVAQKEIPALGHTAGQKVEENRVESTCTQEGHYDEVIYCTVCNKEITRETKTIKAKGHTYSTEWTIDKGATCEETGEKSHHCTECGERVDITTIEALGHDYEEKIIEPTETEQGYTLHTCKRCGKEYKDNFVPAKKAPIQIKDGVKDTEIIEKDDQKYIIVNPNTSTEDLKEKIDSDNKYDINDKDNNNKNGNLSTGDKLIVDGDKNTNYKIIVKGDVNGDGKIDFMGDVVLLNNYRIGLIKLSTEALLAGDINQDGKIDFVEDVVKINNFRLSAIKSLNK